MISIVLDTNVLLVSISEKSRLHWVFLDLLDAKYELCITTEILAEYEEIICQKMGSQVSESILALLDNLPNIRRINTYFHFHLLEDKDDNKFVDCAIAANAVCIVSHDKDFKKLSTIEFPKVMVIETLAFRDLLDNNQT